MRTLIPHRQDPSTKDSSYFYRVEEAVRLLATSTSSVRIRVELAFTSFLLPIIPMKPNDSIDRKLCEALALATKCPALIEGEGTIRATLRKVTFGTLRKIMDLIFASYLEMRPGFVDQANDRHSRHHAKIK